jgi:hypothetical protein
MCDCPNYFFILYDCVYAKGSDFEACRVYNMHRAYMSCNMYVLARALYTRGPFVIDSTVMEFRMIYLLGKI